MDDNIEQNAKLKQEERQLNESMKKYKKQVNNLTTTLNDVQRSLKRSSELNNLHAKTMKYATDSDKKRTKSLNSMTDSIAEHTKQVAKANNTQGFKKINASTQSLVTAIQSTSADLSTNIHNDVKLINTASEGASDKLSNNIDLMSETFDGGTDKLAGSVDNMTDQLEATEKAQSKYVQRLKTVAKWGAVAGAAGGAYYGAKAIRGAYYDAPKAVVGAPIKAGKNVYRASGAQEGLKQSAQYTGDEFNKNKNDAWKSAFTAMSGGVLGSLGSDIAFGGIKSLFGGGDGEKGKSGRGVGFTKEGAKGTFATLGNSIGDAFDKFTSPFRGSGGSKAFNLAPTDEYKDMMADNFETLGDKVERASNLQAATDLGHDSRTGNMSQDQKDKISASLKAYHEAEAAKAAQTPRNAKLNSSGSSVGDSTSTEMMDAIIEQNELLDVQLTGGKTSKKPKTRRAKQAKLLQEQKKPVGQARSIANAIGSSIADTTSKTYKGFVGGLGLKQIMAYAVPVFGGGYRADLPSTKNGVFNAMNQTLGLIYVSSRFAADESNALLLQIGELIRRGFGLEGKLKPPRSRSLSQAIGGLVRGKTSKLIETQAKAGKFGETLQNYFVKRDADLEKTKIGGESITTASYNRLTEILNALTDGGHSKKELDSSRYNIDDAMKTPTVLVETIDKLITSSTTKLLENRAKKKASFAVAKTDPKEVNRSGLAMLHQGEFIAGAKSLSESIKDGFLNAVFGKKKDSTEAKKEGMMGLFNKGKSSVSNAYNNAKEEEKKEKGEQKTGFLGKLAGIFGIFTRFAKNIGKAVGESIGELSIFKSMTSALNDIRGAFVSEDGMFKGVTDKISNVISPLNNALKGITQLLIGTAKKVPGGIVGAFETMKSFQEKVIEDFQHHSDKSGKGFLGTLWSMLKHHTAQIPTYLTSLNKWIGEQSKSVSVYVTGEVTKGMKNSWKDIFQNAFPKWIRQGFDNFQHTLYTLGVEPLITSISNIIENIQSIPDVFASKLTSNTIMDKIAAGFSTGFATIADSAFDAFMAYAQLSGGAEASVSYSEILAKNELMKKGAESYLTPDMATGVANSVNLMRNASMLPGAMMMAPMTAGSAAMKGYEEGGVTKGISEFGSEAIQPIKTLLTGGQMMDDFGNQIKVAGLVDMVQGGKSWFGDKSSAGMDKESLTMIKRVFNVGAAVLEEGKAAGSQMKKGLTQDVTNFSMAAQGVGQKMAPVHAAEGAIIGNLATKSISAELHSNEAVIPLSANSAYWTNMTNSVADGYKEAQASHLKLVKNDNPETINSKLDLIIRILRGNGKGGTGKGILGTLISVPISIASSVTKSLFKVTGSVISGVAKAVSSAMGNVADLIGGAMKVALKAAEGTLKLMNAGIRATVEAVKVGYKGLKFAVVNTFKNLGAIIMAPFKAIGGMFKGLMAPFKLLGKGKEIVKSKFKAITQGEVIGVAPDGKEIRTRFGFKATYMLLKQFMNEQFEIGIKTFALLRLAHGKDTPAVKKMKLKFAKRGGMKLGETGSGLMDLLKKGFGLLKGMFGSVTTVLGSIAGAFGIKKFGGKILAKLGIGAGKKVGAKAGIGAAIKAGGGKIAKGAGGLVKGVAAKVGLGAAAKTMGKVGGKGVLKSAIKKIPIVGLLAGIGFGLHRVMKGDFAGAALEVASGAASLVPGLGTAASLAIDAGIAGRDIHKAVTGGDKKVVDKLNQVNKAKEVTEKPKAKVNVPGYAVGGTINEYASGKVDSDKIVKVHGGEYVFDKDKTNLWTKLLTKIAGNKKEEFKALPRQAGTPEWNARLAKIKEEQIVRDRKMKAIKEVVANNRRIRVEQLIAKREASNPTRKNANIAWSGMEGMSKSTKPNVSSIDPNTMIASNKGKSNIGWGAPESVAPQMIAKAGKAGNISWGGNPIESIMAPLTSKDSLVKQKIDQEVGKMKIANAGVEANLDNVGYRSDDMKETLTVMTTSIVNSNKTSTATNVTNGGGNAQGNSHDSDVLLDKLFYASFS